MPTTVDIVRSGTNGVWITPPLCYVGAAVDMSVETALLDDRPMAVWVVREGYGDRARR
jgi:hypothetical protein